MKIGPVYMLWVANWLGLMRERDNVRQELEYEREKLEELRQRVEQRSAQPAPSYQNSEAQLVAVKREGPHIDHREPETPAPTKRAMMEAMTGWTSQFILDGQPVGGPLPMSHDPLLEEQLAHLGGAAGKRILELGPMDGAHTRILCGHGAAEVTAIEGFRECWLRCLVTKEVFDLSQARFLYGDFCKHVESHDGPAYDIALARGVLYHQANPAELIHGLGRVADSVVVWSQVADGAHPGGPEVEVTANGKAYRGRVNDYGGARDRLLNYCGGVHPTAVWLFPEELRRAFRDAGYSRIIEAPTDPTPAGPAVQFVASKG